MREDAWAATEKALQHDQEVDHDLSSWTMINARDIIIVGPDTWFHVLIIDSDEHGVDAKFLWVYARKEPCQHGYMLGFAETSWEVFNAYK